MPFKPFRHLKTPFWEQRLGRGLTAMAVERAKPPAKGQVEHFDKGFPGLALRLSYGGSKSFIFFYRIGGRQRRMTLGTYPAISLADARELWREARKDVAQGRDPALGRKRDKAAQNFAEVAREWLTRVQSKNKSGRQVELIVEGELIQAWGHRNIADIGRRDILDLVDSIADRGSIAMASRVQSYIRALLIWCMGRGIIVSDPSAHLPKLNGQIHRDRVLNNAELVAVWRGAVQVGYPYGTVVQLLILTGCRRDEIGGLTWSEIDGEMIRLPGERTKNKRPHEVPLSTPAKLVIERTPRFINPINFVFLGERLRPISAWSRAKIDLDTACQVEGWRLHDIRRTVATGMAEIGVAPHIVEAVLNHVSGAKAGVAGVYNRAVYAREKAAALEAWGAHVMALVCG
jgi:integrase